MTKKQQWFESQCKDAGINAEEIKVVGDYATNKDGDFLYSVTHKDGDDTMNYVAACDLADCESNYAEWLLNLMHNLEEGYREGDMRLTTRSERDWREIAQVFKECICRNQEFIEEWREELRRKPTFSVYEPYEDWMIKGKYLGLRELTEDSWEEIPAVILPEEFEWMGGYRFALKVTNIDEFIEIYSNVKYDGNHKPFRILCDLENEVEKAWRNEGKVMSEYFIDAYDKSDEFGLENDVTVWFRFSHFEVDNEIDERFRTFYACYMVKFDK